MSQAREKEQIALVPELEAVLEEFPIWSQLRWTDEVEARREAEDADREARWGIVTDKIWDLVAEPEHVRHVWGIGLYHLMHAIGNTDARVRKGMQRIIKELHGEGAHRSSLTSYMDTSSIFTDGIECLEDACEFAGHAYQDLYAGFDMMAQLVWSFFELKGKYKEARFPGSLAQLRFIESTHEWIRGMGFEFSEGGTPYPLQDSTIRKLTEQRNLWSHSLTGTRISRSGYEGIGAISMRVWDHNREISIEIPAPTPREMFTFLDEAYRHYRASWQGLFEVLNGEHERV